jgi:hypothetical protein
MPLQEYLVSHDTAIYTKMLEDLNEAGGWAGWNKGNAHPSRYLNNTFSPMIEAVTSNNIQGLFVTATEQAHNPKHPIHAMLSGMHSAFLEEAMKHAPETLSDDACRILYTTLQQQAVQHKPLAEGLAQLKASGVQSVDDLLKNKQVLKEIFQSGGTFGFGGHGGLTSEALPILWEQGFYKAGHTELWERVANEAPALLRESGYEHIRKHLGQSLDALPQATLKHQLDALVAGHIPKATDPVEAFMGSVGRFFTGWIPAKGVVADIFNKDSISKRANETADYLGTQWPTFKETGHFSSQAQFDDWLKQLRQSQGHAQLNGLLGNVQKQFGTQVGEARHAHNIINGAVVFMKQRYHDTHVFAQQTDELARGFEVKGLGKLVASAGNFFRNIIVNQALDSPQEQWVNKLLNKQATGNLVEKMVETFKGAGQLKSMFLLGALFTFTQSIGATTKEKKAEDKAKIFGWEFMSMGVAFMATSALVMKLNTLFPTLISKLVPAGRGFTNFTPFRAGGFGLFNFTIAGAVLGLGSQMFLMEKVKQVLQAPIARLFGKPPSVLETEAKDAQKKQEQEKKEALEHALKLQSKLASAGRVTMPMTASPLPLAPPLPPAS